MKPTFFSPRAIRNVFVSCLLLCMALTVAHSQPVPGTYDFGQGPSTSPKRTVKLPVEPGAVEIAFTDGSNLRMLLRDEKITLVTPHGKLLIAATDIQRIEFATRISEEDAKRISTAIADLGSSEFSKREAAGVTLLKLREKAHPALLRAVEQKDPEVVRRAKDLIQQITAAVPAERLVVREKDMVYTADSTIAGRIEGVSMKAHTSQFGVLQVKLSDMHSLRSQAIQSIAQPAVSKGFSSKELLEEAHKKMAEAKMLQMKAKELDALQMRNRR